MKKLTLALIAIFTLSVLNPLFSQSTERAYSGDEIIQSCGCGCADKKVEKKGCPADCKKACCAKKAEAKKSCCGSCSKDKKACSVKKACGAKKACTKCEGECKCPKAKKSCSAKKACGAKKECASKKACAVKKECPKAKKSCCGSCPKAAAKAAEFKWFTDFEAAKKVAAEKKLPMLVDFSGSDWCGWCVKLDNEVFSKDAFKNYAKENLVTVLLDFPRKSSQTEEEKKANRALMQKHGVRGFPTVLLLKSDGETVIKKTGYKAGGPEKYVEHIKELLK